MSLHPPCYNTVRLFWYAVMCCNTLYIHEFLAYHRVQFFLLWSVLSFVYFWMPFLSCVNVYSLCYCRWGQLYCGSWEMYRLFWFIYSMLFAMATIFIFLFYSLPLFSKHSYQPCCHQKSSLCPNLFSFLLTQLELVLAITSCAELCTLSIFSLSSGNFYTNHFLLAIILLLVVVELFAIFKLLHYYYYLLFYLCGLLIFI